MSESPAQAGVVWNPGSGIRLDVDVAAGVGVEVDGGVCAKVGEGFGVAYRPPSPSSHRYQYSSCSGSSTAAIVFSAPPGEPASG